jgi:predicted RND superfamily exporter protein
MKRLAGFIISHKRLIIATYIILIALSLVGAKLVSIQYDLSSYLPGKMNSIVGKDILNDEFGINGTASLLIKDKDLYEIKSIKDKIQGLSGVKKVVWLDDVEDIKKPEEFFDEELSQRFISWDYSLLQIQFFDGNDAESTKDALGNIKNLVNKEHYIGGPAAVSADMRDTVSREIAYYSAAAL